MRSSLIPNPRRLRLIAVACFVLVVLYLLYNQDESNTRAGGNDFFSRTASGLDRANNGDAQAPMNYAGAADDASPRLDHDNDGSVDEHDDEAVKEMAERLRQAEQDAKDAANAKAPHPPDNPEMLVGIGNSAGQPDDITPEPESEMDAKDRAEAEALREEQETNDQLDAILRRSPVIIFSKSYCPHSRKAKRILLEKYTIDPRPFVVELDEHPLGAGIQARLLAMTGRGTVPNVLINGKSIGGGDEVEDLHNHNKLITQIESLGSVGKGKSSKVTVTHAKA